MNKDSDGEDHSQFSNAISKITAAANVYSALGVLLQIPPPPWPMTPSADARRAAPPNRTELIPMNNAGIPKANPPVVIPPCKNPVKLHPEKPILTINHS